MPPTPTPQPEEIAAVQEIAGETSYASVESKVNALNDAVWARVKGKIEIYEAEKPKQHVKMDSKIKADFAELLRELRRDVRGLLGMDRFTADERPALPGSVVVPTRLTY